MRKEMVSLLSLDERSHSQLVDALPEKIGLQHALQIDGCEPARATDEAGQQQAGSGGSAANPRRRFERLLKEIAEFRAPHFEAAQSTLSQGSFALKSAPANYLCFAIFLNRTIQSTHSCHARTVPLPTNTYFTNRRVRVHSPQYSYIEFEYIIAANLLLSFSCWLAICIHYSYLVRVQRVLDAVFLSK